MTTRTKRGAGRPSPSITKDSAHHFLAVLIGIAVLTLLGAGCVASGGNASEAPPTTTSATSDSETTEEADKAIPVAALPLHRGSIEAVLRYSTNLEAESEVGVYAATA